MTYYTELRDIRFEKKDARQIFRYRLFPRNMMVIKDGHVEIHKIPYGTAYKIFKLIPIEVFNENTWISIDNSLEKLQKVFQPTTKIEEKVSIIEEPKPIVEVPKIEKPKTLTLSDSISIDENIKMEPELIEEELVTDDENNVEDLNDEDSTNEESKSKKNKFSVHFKSKKK